MNRSKLEFQEDEKDERLAQIYAIYGIKQKHNLLFLLFHAIAFSLLSTIFFLYFHPICVFLESFLFSSSAAARFSARFLTSNFFVLITILDQRLIYPL